jgi:D-alanyl-D-alanine carboxypeptidase
MKTTSILLLTFLALSLRVQAQLPAAYASKLQYTLDSLCKKLKIPGATAAVYVPAYGIWEGAYGEASAGVPMRSDMALPLNSNTKTYVATALLKLQETGRLSLDDSIGKWIHGRQHISGAITIRQMLNHTSGLYSYTDSSDFSDSIESDFARVWQPDEMLRFVGPPLFAPGTSWSYSNTNYLLAGMIIAQVQGKPVEQAIRELVLTPQGLNSTWFFPQETPGATIPHFWFGTASGPVDGNSFGYRPESFYSAANAAGALFATAKDNVLFWQKLSSGKIVNAASLGEWRNTVRLNSIIGYGLGMFRYQNFSNRVVYEHGGTGIGAINENLVDSASGVCISLLTNQDVVDNDGLFRFVIAALHSVTLAPPTTAVARINMNPEWKLFPVPASSELHLSGIDLRGTSVLLRDMTGRIIRNEQADELLQIDGLANGQYWLELRNDKGALGMRRFEVQR